MSSIDVLQLLHIAYNGSKEERAQATKALESAVASPEAGPTNVLTMLRAGVDASRPVEQSLSCLLYAKNAITHSLTDDVVISTAGFLQEMEAIIFSNMFTVPETHRRILRACATVLINGFEWNYISELMPMIHRDLAAVPLEESLATLQLLYTFTKRFKTVMLDPVPLKVEICSRVMEVLPGYLTYQDLRICRFVLKISECITETALQLNSSKEMPANAADGIFQMLLAFPQQYFEVAKKAGGAVYSEYVRCMKRIAMISYSILNDATRRKKPAPVAKQFLKTFALSFFVVWRDWLSFCVSSPDRHTHQKSEMFALRYLKLCTLDEKLYSSEIQPKAMEIIETILFPYLCYGEEDEEVFADEDDLSGYVQYMMEEGFGNAELSTRQASSNAILAMMSHKKSFHDPAPLLQSIVGVLTIGFESADYTTEAGASRHFGFLHLLSILRKCLREVPDLWQTQMAQVLMRYVAPSVQPTVPSVGIRCKAIVVLQRYSKVPMPSEEDFASFVRLMYSLLHDADARVRLASIDAMCSLLEMKRARAYLSPALVPLVEESLSLLNKVQTTFIPTVILHLATYFAPELSPVMGKLGHTLVEHLLAIVFDMERVEDSAAEVDLAQYEQSSFSADALLDAIYTVVTSCGENEAAFLAMRPDVLRMVRRVLEQPDNFDLLDKTLSILLHVVYFSKPIPAECWDLLPLVFQLVESGIGVDFFSTIEEVLDNYMSAEPVAFLTNSTIMAVTFQSCQKMLIGGVVCTPECQMAPAQLVESMLHIAKSQTDHPGLFDAHLPNFATLLLQALLHPDIQNGDVRVRIWIIAALMDMLYYDAAATFELLVRYNAYPSFFDGLLHFLRGCVAGASAAATSATASPGRRRKGRSDDPNEVLDHLSILTRKVLILGLSSLLHAIAVPGPAAVAHPNYAAFTAEYAAPITAVIQFCIFTNERLYAGRCAAFEANLERLRLGLEEEVEDLDPNDDAILGVDGGDDTEEPMDDDEDDPNHGAGEDDAGLLVDEGDNYESPIDNINEVDIFMSWLHLIPQQSEAVQSSIHRLLRPESDYARASQTFSRYHQVCTELEGAMKEDFKSRATASSN